MDNCIEELRQNLKELELKSEWETLHEKYLSKKKLFEGKCLSSHALAKPLYSYSGREGTYFSANRIDKVYIGLSSYGYRGEGPVIETFEDFKAIGGQSAIIAKGECISIRLLPDNEYEIQSRSFREIFGPSTSFGEYALSLQLYESLKGLLRGSCDNFFHVATKKLQFDVHPCKEQLELLEAHGAKMIDLEDDEVYLLHDKPFRYGRKLVVNEISRAIIKDLLRDARDSDLKDNGFSVKGVYYPPTGFYKRMVTTLSNVLAKMN
jgi:hypothetical protein